MILVAPVTSYRGQPWVKAAPRLYPRLEAGSVELPQDSVVLLDQLQALDVRRVLRSLGELNDQEYACINQALVELVSR